MAFTIRGEEEMNGKIAARLNEDDKAEMRRRALMAGLSLSAFIRRCCLGRKVVLKPNRAVLEYMRRGGEEIRAAHIHAGDPDRTRAHAEAALGWLREAMDLLSLD